MVIQQTDRFPRDLPKNCINSVELRVSVHAKEDENKKTSCQMSVIMKKI